MPKDNRFSGLMSGLNSSDKKALTTAIDEAKAITEAEGQSKPKSTKPMPKSKDPNYVQIGIYLPKELHQKLKIGSAMTGEEMSAIAQAGIEMWLAENVSDS